MKKVLVVDDVAANRLVLASLLKRMDCEIFCASSPTEARQLFLEHQPAVVLTDLHMPSESEGIALAAELRTMPNGAELRIALMTGDGCVDARCEQLFDVILEKPVLLEELKAFLGEKK